MIENDNLRFNLKNNGYEFSKNYKWEYVAKKIFETYKKFGEKIYKIRENVIKNLDKLRKDKNHELTIFEMLKVDGDNLITLGYRFDRLNTDDKLVLCYVVLTALLYGDIIEDIDSKINYLKNTPLLWAALKGIIISLTYIHIILVQHFLATT